MYTARSDLRAIERQLFPGQRWWCGKGQKRQLRGIANETTWCSRRAFCVTECGAEAPHLIENSFNPVLLCFFFSTRRWAVHRKKAYLRRKVAIIVAISLANSLKKFKMATFTVRSSMHCVRGDVWGVKRMAQLLRCLLSFGVIRVFFFCAFFRSFDATSTKMLRVKSIKKSPTIVRILLR